jgi:hypothetical protein
MIFLFLQNPEWPCDEFFQKAARYRKMSSPRSSPQIQKYGGFVVCSRLAALSVPEKKIQNYSCCRLAISKIYRGQRIWILYSSKISIRSEYGLFRKQPVRHRCLCLSVDLLYFSKNHTQLQHESAKRYKFLVTYVLLSAAFRLQLKTLSCRHDGSSSRISSSLILQNLMELIVCLWLPSSFSKTKNGRTDDLCVLPKCCARRDMGLSKTIRKLSMAVFSAPLLDSKVFSLPSYVSACLLSPKFKIATRQTLWVLALPKNRHEHLLCSSCSAKRSSE